MADYAEALNQHQALEFANKFISCLEDEGFHYLLYMPSDALSREGYDRLQQLTNHFKVETPTGFQEDHVPNQNDNDLSIYTPISGSSTNRPTFPDNEDIAVPDSAESSPPPVRKRRQAMILSEEEDHGTPPRVMPRRKMARVSRPKSKDIKGRANGGNREQGSVGKGGSSEFVVIDDSDQEAGAGGVAITDSQSKGI